MDLSKVVKIGLIAGISIIAIIATTNMLFPSNAINLHEQGCMSLANQMIENIDHICQLSGNSNHVGIGTDLDGAFGIEQTPTDIDTIADLQKIPLMLCLA